MAPLKMSLPQLLGYKRLFESREGCDGGPGAETNKTCEYPALESLGSLVPKTEQSGLQSLSYNGTFYLEITALTTFQSRGGVGSH